ncbi:CrcB family protein [Anaerobacillus alkaliphilus]|uniref:Fluoride-specific ion channel FluC n=1 Tax=Anaerobacillus alkaliphilus TaxID=1548597 RepID=A0A4Q0VN56_9BACI|nr:CrcB family protein [Anaerobacillus alkaliphilus]RXI96406.1 CrcB family protein [Anaerobacillus alkaliphilus]
MSEHAKNIIAVGVGAAIGTISRYSLNLLTLESGYPYGTIIENLFGSLLLGFLTAWFFVFVPKEWVRTGLGVGLCGGFTTMSTLAADTSFLMNHYTVFDAGLYVFGTMFGGIILAFIGYRAGSVIAKKTRQKKEVNPA